MFPKKQPKKSRKKISKNNKKVSALQTPFLQQKSLPIWAGLIFIKDFS